MEKYDKAMQKLNEIYKKEFRQNHDSESAESFREAFTVLYDIGEKLKRSIKIFQEL